MHTRSSVERRLAPLAIVALSLALAGCPPPVTHYSDPGTFARELFRVAREGDVAEWGTLLTRARREQGRVYVRDHFGRWQRTMLEIEEGPFGGDLSKASFRINEGALEFEYEDKWVHILRVEMEDGGWKINQD